MLIEAVRETEIFIGKLVDGMEQMLDPKLRAKASATAAILGKKYNMDELVNTYGELYSRLILEKQSSGLRQV